MCARLESADERRGHPGWINQLAGADATRRAEPGLSRPMVKQSQVWRQQHDDGAVQWSLSAAASSAQVVSSWHTLLAIISGQLHCVRLCVWTCRSRPARTRQSALPPPRLDINRHQVCAPVNCALPARQLVLERRGCAILLQAEQARALSGETINGTCARKRTALLCRRGRLRLGTLQSGNAGTLAQADTTRPSAGDTFQSRRSRLPFRIMLIASETRRISRWRSIVYLHASTARLSASLALSLGLRVFFH